MKKRLLLLSFFAAAATFTASAQDAPKADPPLVIFGSVDTYYKNDFSGFKSAGGSSNIGTSFASDQNSISIGMIDLGLKKKVGKAAFVGEMSFGPRGQAQSIPNGASGDSYHIQNLYVSYDLSDKFTVTGGYMATFVGYEVISPVGNFNYSTSYLFTNGPFQNAGLKGTYTFSDKASLMAGVFNDSWNNYSSTKDVSTFGAQLFLSPAKGWTAYLNVVSGKTSGTEFDITTAYQITDAFKLGLNAADFNAPNSPGGFQGIALYPQIAASSSVSFGLRGEYFKVKDGGPSVKAFTLTSNIKAGPLTIIPELRLDKANDELFVDSKMLGTKSASQFVLAAVYSF
ncbi:porin [Mucilaginibacter sp.]|uniref:porin n=1 Tax=Mucilaginibacter sp. TaxID=1882438 RepID=UPI003267B0F7